MDTLRSNGVKRVFAALMAMILLLGMLPIPGITAATDHHADAVTISVKDGEGNPIGGASVHYVITGEGIETLDSTKTTDAYGTVEVLAAGEYVEETYKISATVSCAAYVTATLSEQSITSADQDFVVRMESVPSITGITVTATNEKYTGEEFPAVQITGTQTGDGVTVSVDGTATVLNADGTNMPKIKNVKSYTVKVDVTREGYADFTQTVTSVISENTLDIRYKGIRKEYTGAEFAAIELEEGATLPAGCSITYKLGETGKATTEIPEISAVGKYKIYVHAEKTGYEDFDETYESEITRATPALAFTAGYEDKGATNAKYDAKDAAKNVYHFAATFTSDPGAVITYSIKNPDSEAAPAYASIGTDGKLTFSGVGTVVVTASLAETTNYAAASITHTICVRESLISFKTPDSDYVFGTNSGVVSTNIVLFKDLGDTGALSFGFADSDDKAITDIGDIGLAYTQTGLKKENIEVKISDYSKLNAALEENNGTLEVKVIATKAAVYWDKAEKNTDNDGAVKYGADTASYTITIKYADCPENPYMLYEPAEKPEDRKLLDAPNGENEWYNTNVVVVPANGYQIAREITDEFGSEVTIADQGTDDKYIYLRSATDGGICKKVLLEGLKIDSVVPSDCTVEYSEPTVSKTIGEVLTLGFFRSEVEVTFTAEDATSGVAYFKWWYVREDGANENNAPSMSEEDAHTVLAMPITEDVKDEESGEIHTVIKGYTATITLTTEEYNQMRGKIFAVAVDAAGHESDESNDNNGFVLDDISPEIMSLRYTRENRELSDKKYYNTPIEFTLTIAENNFFPDDVKVTVKKGTEQLTPAPKVIWSETTSSSNQHTGTFTVGSDEDENENVVEGDYTVTISYTDKSGNPMQPNDSTDSEKTDSYTVPYTFVIDKTPPAITPTYSEEDQSIKLVVKEHSFNPEDIEVAFEARDIAGNEVTVNQTEVLDYIRDPGNWKIKGDEHSLTVDQFSDANYTLKFNYTDLAANPLAEETSLSFTIDHTAPNSEKMTVSYSKSLRDTLLSGLTLGFYQPQVTVTFTAYDVTSGVQSFVWGYNRQAEVSESNLGNFDGKTPLKAEQDGTDKTKFTASVTLPEEVADQLRGNIRFHAIDGKGNESDKVTDNGTVLVVDSIAPQITDAVYSASNATVGTDRYYNHPATLTLTFREANFFQEDVQIKIEREGGGASQATVAWVSNSADEHVATITFPAPVGGGADGHYTVTADYTDRSDNKMTTFTSDRITIDTTAPTISVSYNNNDLTNRNYFTKSENAKFFKAGREATITIVEHNFDASKVTVAAAAAGRGAQTPAISGWTDNGDTHTATVTFSADGDYTFDVSVIDAAENASGNVDYGNSAAPKEFTIDTKPDMIAIAPDSVVEGKAYTYDDVIIPDITISDDNLEGYEITLKGVQRGSEIDLSKQANGLVKDKDNLATALLDVFGKKAELDGIYTLTVRSADLSDNTDEKIVRFTVNRFGSVYEYGERLMSLIADGGTYNRSLDEDLTLTIYNASSIDPKNVSVVITRDGRPTEAVFTVTETTADSDGWYSYLVTIDKSNFAEDGVYTVSATTTDDADNTVENTKDNSAGDIRFYIDSTAPQLTSVSGLEERIVNATELEVSYTVYDTIGLASVQVKVDGEIVDTATEFDDASNYSGKFTIYEKSNEQHVSFVLTDKAGNVTESDAAEFAVPYTLENDVTVSTNLFVRWFANKPLFFGTIGGGVVVLGGLGTMFGLKKKKSKVN